MNQDAFRQLLTTPRPGSSSSLTPSRAGGPSTKKATLDPSQPTFQPRKVKRKAKDSDYRDRASERRAGVNDYAQVESVLEDFEQRTAENEDRDQVEEQRQFLGGDQDHTILVKGLDYALLEQNKARAVSSHEDDDSLEAAFQEAQPAPVVPKKRTREDIIRELKEKRVTGTSVMDAPKLVADDDSLERAKRVGKFKPIGAPEESNDNQKSKKAKGKGKAGEGERKKKRRKVVRDLADASENLSSATDRPPGSMMPPSEPPKSAISEDKHISSNQAASSLGDVALDGTTSMEVDADVDIFADAGDYEGVDLGEDDEDERLEKAVGPAAEASAVSGPSEANGHTPVKSWFKDDSDPTPLPGSSTTRPPTPPPVEPVLADEESEQEQPVRLAPLASSALPSISDFLAMDKQAETQQKRKAKKEKKKGDKKEKVSTEAKVDRDYQRLNSYMAKKGSGSGATKE